MEHDPASGTLDVLYRNGPEALQVAPPPDGDGGCSVSANGRFDPALLAVALAYLARRRRSVG